MDIENLQGLTIKEIVGDESSEQLRFFTADDREFLMSHSQDCCESVYIEEIVGDLKNLIGSPILSAEAVSSSDPDEQTRLEREKAKEADEWKYTAESETWTFYKLATIKGSVTIRWYGSSNGYYSESVDFVEVGYKEAEWR